ncbi:alkaline phosphatase D family protein [Streptomyces mexicanus]|uniref:alkaline phosphatase D family protein n=1 Tax=Streptomyces mexicanus TaxID=178566 RepID=UPI0031ED48D4
MPETTDNPPSSPRPGPPSRRLLIGGAVAAAAVLAFPGAASARSATTALRADPFTLGVASGDPLPDSVVLWTRLAPDPLDTSSMPSRPVPVHWQIAEDEHFRRVVAAGTVTARPELGHSVHVEPRGLRPDRWYHYRFKAGRHLSPVGRTRTAPPPAAGRPLRLAAASCQSLVDGYFTAYRHLAEEDVDLVVFLGDWIYEDPDSWFTGGVIRPQGDYEPMTLDQYRHRHAEYRMDPDLQLVSARVPFMPTWDDHDVVNNWADMIEPVGRPHPTPDFAARRAAAFQAYYEHLPLRRAQMPNGPDAQMYRRLRWGRTVDLLMLDTRQYRDDQACGDGNKVVCEEWSDPQRTMLGRDQENWLLDRLATSPAVWKAVPQQVPMGQWELDNDPAVRRRSMDTWDGYPAARRRILQSIADRGVENVAVLSGDVHWHMAHDLTLDMEDPDSAPLAADFVCTSVTSGRDGNDTPTSTLPSNPHLKYSLNRRGYLRCTVDERHWRTDYRVVPYVTRPGAPVETRRSLVVEAGRPGLQDG